MPRRTTLTVVAVVVVAAGVVLVVRAGGGGKGLAPEAGTGQVATVAAGVSVVPEAQRRPLPAFTGRTLDNQELDLASLRGDRKSTRLNSSHVRLSRMPSSA